MASVLRTPIFRLSAPPRPPTPLSSKYPKPFCISFKQSSSFGPSPLTSLCLPNLESIRFLKFTPFAYNGETETTDNETQELQESEDSSDSTLGVEDSTGDNEVTDAGETPASPILMLIQSYKEALANNDETKVAELESSLKSIEDEKIGLEGKISSLLEELSIEKDRILRISADFDNFRKRTERDRLSLVTNAQGELVESLLPVLDNFERAKAQIKAETEGEEKINNSYQSIHKQFIEILTSLGVEPVETVGKPFDPLAPKPVGSKFNRVLDELFQTLNQLHEAIMREDSTDFEDGIIIEEFRKGFKLGDRLLRPSMVKVSAGPGSTKLENEALQENHDPIEIFEGSTESESA